MQACPVFTEARGPEYGTGEQKRPLGLDMVSRLSAQDQYLVGEEAFQLLLSSFQERWVRKDGWFGYVHEESSSSQGEKDKATSHIIHKRKYLNVQGYTQCESLQK